MSMKPSSSTQKSASVNSLQRDVLPHPVEERGGRKEEEDKRSKHPKRSGGELDGPERREFARDRRERDSIN